MDIGFSWLTEVQHQTQQSATTQHFGLLATTRHQAGIVIPLCLWLELSCMRSRGAQLSSSPSLHNVVTSRNLRTCGALVQTHPYVLRPKGFAMRVVLAREIDRKIASP